MISVIIPVYNVDHYLRRCLEAVQRQTFSDFEVILVDDGSTDSSGAICDDFCSDTRFRTIHQNHSGVSAARNRGLRAAAGEYVLFLDADDWPADDMLEKLSSGIGEADLAMCYHYLAYEREDGGFSYLNPWPSATAVSQPQDKYYDVLTKSATLWNKLIRRTAIGSVCFDETMTYGEDAVFLCEIFHNISSVVIVPENLYYYYRNRRGNVVSAQLDERSLEFLSNTKKVFELCNADGHVAVGVKRICSVVAEVEKKLRQTNPVERARYQKACRELMRCPSFSQYWTLLRDPHFSLRERFGCARMRWSPFYGLIQAIKERVLEREDDRA